MEEMTRSLLAALYVLGAWAGVPSASRPATAPVADACIPPIKCCKICQAGKACGNSCIAENQQCHKGRGCACDAAEVCAEDP